MTQFLPIAHRLQCPEGMKAIGEGENEPFPLWPKGQCPLMITSKK